MGLTVPPATPASPAAKTVPAAWLCVVASAAMLAALGSTVGSMVIFGVLYAKATGWHGPLPLWEYMKLRDIGEEITLSLAMWFAYRTWPVTSRTLHDRGGVLKVAVVFGIVAMVATRVYYGVDVQRPTFLALSLVLYVVFIAYPIAWTFARMAPDGESELRPDANRLTDRELFQTILGLFLVVGSLYFMHWVTWSPAAGLINFFGLFVIPAAAVVLGVGARKMIAGACKAIDAKLSGAFITTLAIGIGWAVVAYHFFFSHPPHSP